MTAFALIARSLAVVFFAAAAMLDWPPRHGLPPATDRAWGNWCCSMGFAWLAISFMP